jgi:hypothetical protein
MLNGKSGFYETINNSATRFVGENSRVSSGPMNCLVGAVKFTERL